MLWRETISMDQKTRFIADYLRQTLSRSKLCVLYGISRKTSYKWIERYIELGPQGLEEKSRCPAAIRTRHHEEIVDALGEMRHRYAAPPFHPEHSTSLHPSLAFATQECYPCAQTNCYRCSRPPIAGHTPSAFLRTCATAWRG